MTNEDYMNLALDQAQLAFAENEVPVGCIIISPDGEIIGTGRNRCEAKNSAVAHAEIEAIKQAGSSVGSQHLEGCSMYVTLEPCPMCAGAIINSRISRLYYGAKEPRFGSCGSIINLFMENYGFSPQVYGSILENNCSAILNEFFKKIRKEKN